MTFDPYHKWLGIPLAEQPANHYRLLAVALFEDDPDVIETAADQRMALLRTFQTGQHSAESQKLLNELSVARLCLLTPEKRSAYDADLRRRLAAAQQPRPAIPAARPLPAATLRPVAPMPVETDTPALIVTGAGTVRTSRKRRQGLSSAASAWLALAAVALPAALYIGYLISTKPQPEQKTPASAKPNEPAVARTNKPAPRPPAPDLKQRVPPPSTPPQPSTFTRLLAEHPEPTWTALSPTAIESAGGADLKLQADGSILAGGANPDRDTYTLVMRTDLPKITGFRLETMAHETFAKGGPGRAPWGNFALSEIRVKAEPLTGPAGPMFVKLTKASADFEQDHYPVAAALDGSNATAWSIDPQTGKDHVAVFSIDATQQVGFPGGTKLTFILDFQYNLKHALGRFRLSATSDASAPQAVIESRKIDVRENPPADRVAAIGSGAPSAESSKLDRPQLAKSATAPSEPTKPPAPRQPPDNAPPSKTSTGLSVTQARWGGGRNWIDVTEAVRANVRDGRYLATAVNEAFGGKDPTPGFIKSLVIQYAIGSDLRSDTFREGRVVYLAAEDIPPHGKAKLTLLEAKCGWANDWLDVTAYLRPLAKGKFLLLRPDIAAGASARGGGPKAMFVRYAVDGEVRRAIASNGEMLCIDARPPVLLNGSVNLLKKTNPKRDAIRGSWQFKVGGLIMPAMKEALLDVPYSLPDEYELTAVVACRAQRDCFILGLPVGGSLTALTIDSSLKISGLSLLDGEWCGRNATTKQGRFLHDGRPNTIVCRVKRDSIQVSCNGKQVIDWRGDSRRLSVQTVWQVRDPRHIFLGGFFTPFEISKLELSPLGTTNGAPAADSGGG